MNKIPLLRMHQTLIFEEDVAKTKDARKVRETWNSVCISLGRVHYYTKPSQDYRSIIYFILFPLSFDLGEIGIFCRYFYCRWPEDQKMGSALMPIEGSFLLPASIQAQVIVKGIRRNETATIKTVRKKPLRPWCDCGDLVELSFLKQNVLQRRVIRS